MQKPNCTECSMCYLPYDDRDHIPYDICKESHSACYSCLMKIKNSQHTACFFCPNPLEERVNKLAQQLLRMLRTMASQAQQNLQNSANINQSMDSWRNSPPKDPDNSMVRTAFFPNPSEFVESLNQSSNQLPAPIKVVPPHHLQPQQQQPPLQFQQHFKAVADKLGLLQAQLNDVSAKYQQCAYKNQQQPPTEQMVQLQRQHVAIQAQVQKMKKYQQDLYAQNKNINPMPYTGPEQQQLFSSFGINQSGNIPAQAMKQPSAIRPQGQTHSSQKNIAKKPQTPTPAAIQSGKMLPSTNDNRIPNMPPIPPK